ncbi:hypothetical protein ACFWJW_01065 [Streptomyces sp. NPDC127097]|uniref:hypothetical protein n=1 Tax=Streptomyces sp. NPDC127097 TaxID=3347136 RepID=UPI00365B7B8C
MKPAQSVVSARLAAGAQIVGPAGSVLRHQGEFDSGEEMATRPQARVSFSTSATAGSSRWELSRRRAGCAEKILIRCSARNI